MFQERMDGFAKHSVTDLPSDIPFEHIVLKKDRPIWADQDTRKHLYILVGGFAFEFTILACGKRHILDFFTPGAICNWLRPGQEEDTGNILLKKGSRALVVERNSFIRLLDENKPLATVVARHELARAMRLSQRVRNLIALTARERIQNVLLDLHDEYRLTGRAEDDRIPLRFSQEEIGDLLGMTTVHVNRTLQALRAAGLVQEGVEFFRLPHLASMREGLGYRNYWNQSAR